MKSGNFELSGGAEGGGVEGDVGQRVDYYRLALCTCEVFAKIHITLSTFPL